MNPRKAKALGTLIAKRREELGISRKQFARDTGLAEAGLIRIERGEVASPRAGTLSQIAEGLGLKAADLFAMADYTTPNELPSLKPYLRTKYGDLPTGEIDAIEAYAADLAAKHGINLEGPAPGEDEA